MMAGNSFGTCFRITTFGESHGGAVGVVVDGAKAGLPLNEEDVQKQLDRRRPGQSEVTTQRRETDTVRILSGVFEGLMTGTPIMMMVANKDARSQDYDEIKDMFRPGHADFTYFKKYGLRDYRGSGRASGRETIGRVAGGAVARRMLAARGVEVLAYTRYAAGVRCRQFVPDEIENNSVRACDPEAAREIERKAVEARDSGNSIGGIVECRITGLPPGLGEPVFDRLDADLAKAVLSIGATKGIEFGAGFAAADMTGKEHNDEMAPDGFLSNNAGGTLGGISTGETVLFRTVFKPTSSISQPQQTVDTRNNPVTCRTEGRHDPCIFPRAIPVVEAMAAIVVEDHFQRAAATK